MNDKVVELLKKYDAFLVSFGVPIARSSDRSSGSEAALSHLRWMVVEMQTRAIADKWSERKTNRWLGFIQGTMWGLGYSGIVDLRNDCRNLYEGKGV